MDRREDIREIEPDPRHLSAFLGGWTAAVKGNLYASVEKKKTHKNMGNLFGWIYGDQPESFRYETWYRYLGRTVEGEHLPG